METVQIKYGKSNQQKTALAFLIIGIIGLGMFYYTWFVKTEGLLIGRVGSIFVSLLGLGVFLKLKIAPKNPDAVAILFSPEGIQGFTTPIAKAAGRVAWTDIEGFYVDKNMLEFKVKDIEKYASKMTNFFVRDTFIKAKKGVIPISFLEVDIKEEEIRQLISRYFKA